MHELALCNAIADTVTTYAAGRPVRGVRVRIGAYRQVVPDTLTFYWEMQIASSDLAQCELSVETVPAVVSCRTCRADTMLAFPILLCGECDGADVELVTGEEFLIESIDVEPASPLERAVDGCP